MRTGIIQRDEAEAGWGVIRRTPVFDERERVAGYELLLGGGRPSNEARTAAGLLAATCADHGLQRIVGARRVYLAGPVEVLSYADELGLPAEQVVLNVSQQTVDSRLLASVAGLVEHGFGIAVDGWALEPAGERLLRLASTVRIVFDWGTRELQRLVARRAELHARGVTLIACDVQTRGEYEECRRLGFDAFQGPYLAEPDPVAVRRTPTFRMAALAEVLSAGGPGAFEELERLILQDAGLAHRFLRLAGSAFYARRARVRSIRYALARLGATAVRRWLLVLILAGLSDTPTEADRHMLGVGLHRGRICELLAAEAPAACPELAFTAGLLSILPALTDRPIDEIAAELPLDQGLADALVDYRGPEGRLLAAAIAYENGQRENADGHPALLAAITRIYADALLWADDTASQAT